jgi:2-polyprenyl-6-methoxyphenol hydroxylase-like FAD-dependent oxidoreductase
MRVPGAWAVLHETTDLLIIGAGPFGLAMAAWARCEGLDHRVVGRPMAFWREHMPAGMTLRPGRGWHLDPHAIVSTRRIP